MRDYYEFLVLLKLETKDYTPWAHEVNRGAVSQHGATAANEISFAAVAVLL